MKQSSSAHQLVDRYVVDLLMIIMGVDVRIMNIYETKTVV